MPLLPKRYRLYVDVYNPVLKKKERMTASMKGDFVVFLIGMRVNQFWKIHKCLPIGSAMTKMLRELYAHPDMGLLHHEMWFGRTTIQVQYWKSMDHLLAYAKNKNAAHLPAWGAFNRYSHFTLELPMAANIRLLRSRYACTSMYICVAVLINEHFRSWGILN